MFMYEEPDDVVGCFKAVVVEGIQEKYKLLACLAQVLRFPEYFGHNWGALADCIRDLEWIDEDHVILVHDDIPLNTLPEQMRIYLEILDEAVKHVHIGNKHLDVVFPAQEKSRIEAILGETAAEQGGWWQRFRTRIMGK